MSPDIRKCISGDLKQSNKEGLHTEFSGNITGHGKVMMWVTGGVLYKKCTGLSTVTLPSYVTVWCSESKSKLSSDGREPVPNCETIRTLWLRPPQFLLSMPACYSDSCMLPNDVNPTSTLPGTCNEESWRRGINSPKHCLL